MPGQLLQCACGHEFEVSGADYGKAGRCARCNRPIRACLRRGDIFLEPCDAPPDFDLPVIGARPPKQSPQIAKPSRAKAETPSVPSCARCGKPFRGEWDRRETPNGLYCYICSTQAADPPPDFKETTPAFEIVEMTPVTSLKFPPAPKPEHTNWRAHAPIALFLGLSAATLGAVFLLPVEKIIPALLTPYSTEDIQNAPDYVHRFSALIPYLALVAALFFWVYAGLLATDNLPYRQFRHNCIVAVVYTAGFFLVCLTGDFAFGMPPGIGLADIIFITAIMYYMFDLDLIDSTKFSIIGVLTFLFLIPITRALQGLYHGLVL